MTVDQYKNRIEIKSSTSDRVYVVSQRISDDTWCCSCPGWKTRRTCKHLREMNLPTAGPPAVPATRTVPARNPKPRSTAASLDFADTPKHYDVHREGLGNPSEWRSLAEKMVRGRGVLKTPAAPPSPVVSSRMAADMAALGVAVMPPDADGLLAAMQARAKVLDDPATGDPEAFWKMFSSFERLLQSYPAA